MLRSCGKELSKLHLSGCWQGVEAYSSGTLGFPSQSCCLKSCLPSIQEPSLTFITGLGKCKASGNSTLHYVRCWGFQTKMSEMRGGAVALPGGKERLWAIKFWKNKYHHFTTFPRGGGQQQHFSREMGGGTDQVNLKKVYESLGTEGRICKAWKRIFHNWRGLLGEGLKYKIIFSKTIESKAFHNFPDGWGSAEFLMKEILRFRFVTLVLGTLWAVTVCLCCHVYRCSHYMS